MKHRTTMLRRAARRAGFTDRELEILTLLVEGSTIVEASGVLGIDAGTARGHMYTARRRAGVRTNEELVAALAWNGPDIG